MKWLSVKKYKPPEHNESVFIRSKSGEEDFHVGWYYVVREEWRECHTDYKIINVTHFCIPDPIEIEDE